jgi:hypothetical protein
MAEPHKNSNIFDLMDSSNPNFDGGSKSSGGFLWCKFYFQFTMYYIVN